MASTPDSSPSGQGQFFYGQSQANFNPTTAVVIISLIGGCFVLAFVALVLRKYLRGDTGLALAQTNATQSGTYNAKPKGLLKADVDALPLVHREDLQVQDGVAHECPVCLAEFQADETLRLLPACNHVFHRDCIDAWFDAHSTCPLCRASLVGEHDGEAKPANSGADEVGGHGEAVDTITEVSENGDSDLESRLSHSSDVPLDGPRVATREAGALLRNSESFKRATTSSDQQPSTKVASFRKPPVTTAASIRRSLSLSADLIALRNLLTRQGGDQNGEAPSRRWFSRARSLHLPPRDRTEGDEWVTIDLETGKAASKNADAPATSKGESSRGPAERAWSGRWSLAGLKGAVAFPLTRSTSDISSHSAHLPI